MDSTDGPAVITHGRLQELASLYEQTIPKSLQDLERIRVKEVPESLTLRKRDGNALLEKDEVKALVEWKLKHGTYRPNLAKLVSSNTVSTIGSITKDAFSMYTSEPSDPSKTIKILANLKGIGPATASLLLSCFDQENVPFFSDELFRYLNFEDARNKGWDRKIGYTMKEYKELFAQVQKLQERLKHDSGQNVSVLDIERAAYVLSKESARSLTKESAKAVRPQPDEAEAETEDVEVRPPRAKRRKNALS